MNKDQATISQRNTAIREALLRLRSGETQTLEKFVTSAGFVLVERARYPHELTRRQVVYSLDKLKPLIWPLKLAIEGENIRILSDSLDTPFSLRKRRASPTKANLGGAIWDFMLGPQWRGIPSEQLNPTPINQELSRISPEILHRAERLRRRNQLYFAADAGTTTLATVQELLQADKIPFRVRLDPAKDNQNFENYRFVEPVLLTNSFPIVQAVTECEKHRWSFIVEFIGGVARPGRNCTSGELTSVWLHVCCAEGRTSTLDLAIIGVTGVYIGDDGVPVVACDDPEEAGLKRKLLEMAGSSGPATHSGIRVLVFHAAKLLYPEARCRFAVITKSMVDLIVIDSGGNDQERAAVRKFAEALKFVGVDLLVVD